MFSTQLDLALIFAPLSSTQKACETNPSREKKNAAVFAVLELAEEKSQSFHSQK